MINGTEHLIVKQMVGSGRSISLLGNLWKSYKLEINCQWK